MPDRNPTQNLQSWNLTLARELGRGTVVEIAYAGSKGTHLPRAYNLNQVYTAPGQGVIGRPYERFSSISMFDNVANSIYSSGTLTLRRRFSKQLFIRAAYVYGKSIDTSSVTVGDSGAAGFTQAQDAHNLGAERGRSDFDVGHSFMSSFIWSPSFSPNRFARGWQIAGTTTLYTGRPITPKVSNYDITKGGAARPNRISSGKLDDPTIDQWFDRTAFPVVPVGAFLFGTSGRNIIDGPGTVNLNFSLSRRFRLTERAELQLRCEAFNAVNRVNLGMPRTQVDVANGATIITAKSPRLMQLGARITF